MVNHIHSPSPCKEHMAVFTSTEFHLIRFLGKSLRGHTLFLHCCPSLKSKVIMASPPSHTSTQRPSIFHHSNTIIKSCCILGKYDHNNTKERAQGLQKVRKCIRLASEQKPIIIYHNHFNPSFYSWQQFFFEIV